MLNRLGAAACGLVAIGMSHADAAVMLDIVRLDDRTASITGSGSFDIDPGNSLIELLGPLDGVDFGDLTILSGSLQAGGHDLLIAYQPAPFFYSSLALSFADVLELGDVVSGTVLVEIPLSKVGIFSPVGTSGDISKWGGPEVLGTFTIHAPEVIPLPSALPLIASGVAALLVFRRRRRDLPGGRG